MEDIKKSTSPKFLRTFGSHAPAKQGNKPRKKVTEDTDERGGIEGGCCAPGLEVWSSWRLLQEDEIDKLRDTSQYLKIATTGSDRVCG